MSIYIKINVCLCVIELSNLNSNYTNSSTKVTEIVLRSTPNLKFLQLISDIQRQFLEHRNSNSLLDGRLCVSMPNIHVRPNLTGETPAEIVWQSTPNLKFLQVTSDVRRQEFSEHCDSKSSLDC